MTDDIILRLHEVGFETDLSRGTIFVSLKDGERTIGTSYCLWDGLMEADSMDRLAEYVFDGMVGAR